MFRHFNPVELHFGENAVKKFDFSVYGKKALIVTGKGGSSAKSGVLDDVTERLEEQEIGYEIFGGVEENPSFETVDNGSDIFVNNGCDFVIGIGGGSPMDAAKAISASAKTGRKTSELFGIGDEISCHPVIEVATTSGTGSEVTQYSVLTAPDGDKLGLRTERIFPKAAIVDPGYTLTVPKNVTVSTGLDALSQLVEGIYSKKSTPLCDALAADALRKVKESLPIIAEDPENLRHRTQMAFASNISGIVISQTGTTIVHALGYPITSSRGIRHGLANMLTLCQVSKDVEKIEPGRVKLALEPFGGIEGLCDFIDSLYPRPKLNLTAEEIDKFSETLNGSGQVAITPGEYPTERIKEIYMAL